MAPIDSIACNQTPALATECPGLPVQVTEIVHPEVAFHRNDDALETRHMNSIRPCDTDIWDAHGHAAFAGSMAQQPPIRIPPLAPDPPL